MASVRKRRWATGGKEREAWLVDYDNRGVARHIRTFRTKKEADAYAVHRTIGRHVSNCLGAFLLAPLR